nr:hypothetical protein [Cyclobacterium salsum]
MGSRFCKKLQGKGFKFQIVDKKKGVSIVRNIQWKRILF